MSEASPSPKPSKEPSKEPSVALASRPAFWLVLGMICAAPLAAVRWDHPNAALIAGAAGGLAILCVAIALWRAFA
ncbi:MAG: hypothetical protein VW338_11810, partial [Rhodospirillaceae bacterium]